MDWVGIPWSGLRMSRLMGLLVRCVCVAALTGVMSGCVDEPAEDPTIPEPEVAKDPFDWAFWNQSDQLWWVQCKLWKANESRFVDDVFNLQPRIITLHLLQSVYSPHETGSGTINQTWGTCAIAPSENQVLEYNASKQVFPWECGENATHCWLEGAWTDTQKTSYIKNSTRRWIIDSNGSAINDIAFKQDWLQPSWTYA